MPKGLGNFFLACEKGVGIHPPSTGRRKKQSNMKWVQCGPGDFKGDPPSLRRWVLVLSLCFVLVSHSSLISAFG